MFAVHTNYLPPISYHSSPKEQQSTVQAGSPRQDQVEGLLEHREESAGPGHCPGLGQVTALLEKMLPPHCPLPHLVSRH